MRHSIPSIDLSGEERAVRIGELSARTGVSQRSLRYYEQQGLMTSARAPSGQRHYGDGEVERVAFIRTMLDVGLSTRILAELMPCLDRPTRQTVEQAEAAMRRERARLAAAAEKLLAACEALDSILGAHDLSVQPPLPIAVR
jgi:DNA-binding transcriptional MerR regulator